MTAGAPMIGATLVILAMLDGMFSGFRSSCGRTALIRHRRQDVIAHLRGVGLVTMLLLPVVVAVVADVALGDGRVDLYVRAGVAMLAVYVPYGLLVLAALGVYALLGWRRRFLASALILGPFTLARPLVSLAGGLAAIRAVADPRVRGLSLATAVAVLAVEPLADRWWYRQMGPPPP